MNTQTKNSIEFVHGDLYGVALEVSKKFVAKTETRPILNYVNHGVDGSIIATDSHRILRVNGIHGFKENYLVNPKTFNMAKGQYPDVEKLFNKDDYILNFSLNKDQIKMWLQMFKSVNQMMKTLKIRYETVTLHFGEGDIKFTYHGQEGMNFSLPVENYIKPEFEKIAFQASYMRDAMEVHQKLNSEKVDFFFRSSIRTFFLEYDKKNIVGLLPVRVY